MSYFKQETLNLLKATVIALVYSLFAILLFAIILNFCSFDQVVIKPVNYLIKVLAVFLGCYFSIKNGKGLIKGAIYGLVITIICFFVFALISKSLNFNIYLLWDMLLGVAIGAITGIVKVNKK